MPYKVKRCVNIDWLEVYCLESRAHYPMDAEFYIAHGFTVDVRDYGTRVYRQMFTLLDSDGQPWVEFRRDPASSRAADGGLFPPESCHIRLTNRACYDNNCISKLREFLARFDYQLVRIYRLDICLDFEKFDRGDDPNKFLQRYMQGRFAKMNQSNISAHGTDRWDGRLWNSVSWGNAKSMVSTKMYCKTLELSTTRDKPYIRWAWFDAGLIDDPVTMTRHNDEGGVYKPDIWRVEFSIKSSARHWFMIDRSTGKAGRIPMPHTLDVYDTREKLLTMFHSLSVHYFRFKVYKSDVRKDRCEDKVLFQFSPQDEIYKIDRLAGHTSNTTAMHRLIIALRNFDLSHGSSSTHEATTALIRYIEQSILHKHSNNMLSAQAIRIMQQLIADRTRGITDKTLSEHMRDIANRLATLTDTF